MKLAASFKKAAAALNVRRGLSAAFRVTRRYWWQVLGSGALVLGFLMIPSARPMSTTRAEPNPLETGLQSAWNRAAAYNPDAVSYRDNVAFNADGTSVCLSAKPASVQSAAPIVVLDPGHHYTQFDPLRHYTRNDVHKILGARNQTQDLTEVDIVDAFAPKLKKELESRGLVVVMTRDPDQLFDRAGTDYPKSLSMRGAMPAFLSEQLGLPVIMLSIHIDDVTDGFNVYVQNSLEEKGNKNSFALARTLAWSYAPGGKAAKVNFYPPEDYKSKGIFLNRALRSFESVQRACSPKNRDAAALLELGNIKDTNDLKRMKRMMNNPNDKMAFYIANGVMDFIKLRYKTDEPSPQPDVPAAPQKNPAPVPEKPQ